MIEKGNQTDNFDIIFKYLSEVANQLEKCLCTSQNKCKKRLIGIKPYDENWEPGNDYCHIVIPHRGVKPVVLYSDLQSVDEGFFLVNLIIKQFEMMILANENQPIGNKYGFYSDYNNSLKPEEAARYIYDVATEIVSGILKDTIGVAFNDIDLLSLTNYESQKAKGTLLFINTNIKPTQESSMCVWTSKDQNIIFESSYIKYIRKLLVGCGYGGLLFVKDSEHPIPYFLGVVDSEKAKFFPITVHISGPLKWELLINGTEAFRREINSISVKNEITVADIIDEIEMEFQKSEDSISIDKKRLTDLITPIYESGHGAAIVLIDGNNIKGKINDWIRNLDSYKKMITLDFSHFDNNSSLLNNTSAMDGAIIVDAVNSKVIAVGAIVDGKTSMCGDPSRGSRYNSLKNFTYIMADYREPILSVVISEDGDKYVFAGKKLLKEYS